MEMIVIRHKTGGHTQNITPELWAAVRVEWRKWEKVGEVEISADELAENEKDLNAAVEAEEKPKRKKAVYQNLSETEPEVID